MTRRKKIIIIVIVGIIGLFFVLIARTLVQGGSIGDKVAVIDITGTISRTQTTIDQIHKYRDDETIKAIVLRINSPGGSVAPVQEIYSELKKLEKPIVASMGSTAASGGYYIAAIADEILANPGTLTGSIGVIMQFTKIKGLYEKIGLEQQVVKSGRFKDTGSPVRDLTDEERELLQATLDDVHNQFIDAVFEGRQEHLAREEIVALADGRIFSGQQALEHKLVDQLGNLSDAIERAGELGGIEGKPKVVRTERKTSMLERLLGHTGKENLDRLLDNAGVTFRYELHIQ
ncbi:signal peptide peptidase SppA [Candidatus Poribacteria bacterium]|nr:MAG: signal peptide peptidase SppA [Candidatus Poribacteria bacterium]